MRSVLIAFLLVGSHMPATAQHKKHQYPSVVAAPPPPQVFTYVEQKAAFPGNASEWIHDNLRYPEQAARSGWTGTVQIMFEISRDGSVCAVSVRKSSGYQLLDNEARRIISLMPQWKPATINGRAIPYLMNISIVFKIG